MNKVARSLTALALSAALSAGMALMPLAYEPKTAETKADVLNTLGLFKGTENGYELDKPLTRMEALIMLIRLSGKELDALYSMKEYEMPFTDAPDWEKADKYLGYPSPRLCVSWAWTCSRAPATGWPFSTRWSGPPCSPAARGSSCWVRRGRPIILSSCRPAGWRAAPAPC